MHGQLLNQRLIDYTGIWGAIAVSLILVSMMVMLYINELRNGWSVLSSGLDGYRAKQAERRARRESRRIQEANEENCRLREENDRLRADLAAAQAATAAAATSQPEPVQPIQPVQPAAAVIDPTPSPAPQPAVTSPLQPAEAPTADCEPAPETVETTEMTDETSEETDVIDSPLFPSSDSDIEHETELETDTEPLTPLFADSLPVINDPDADIVDPSGLPPYDPRADLSNFRFPDIELLRPAKESGPSIDVLTMEENKQRIINTLKNCGVTISHIEATIGPTVTLYEIIPADGVRTRSIKSLGDDLQLRLAALGIRIIAPIPAKGTIGIEVPNKDPQVVPMRTVLDSQAYRDNRMELPMALGKTISGDIFMADLAKMPHLLVAGATGMGKSVGLNAIIASLLYKKHPAELKFVLIDPKRVELSLYRKLERHYLAALPDEEAIITDMSKVVTVLNSLCIEMDNRLKLLEKAGARNIKEYNEKFIARRLNMNKHRFLPYIVLVIDEFADLIIRQGKEIEEPVSRLAAVARAAGIHLIIATQRPTVNVITGNIKLNIPGRIAFRVIQGNDSRTILDQLGANQLIGKGDMLFSNNGKLERVQCAFIDTPEVSDICDSIGEQVGYTAPYELPEYVPEGNDTASVASLTDRDPLFDECARFIVSSDTASTSSLQRRYNIGYNRAGRIMDQMEAAGIVGASQGGKPRSVLVDLISLERILDNR
ncbi:MAG: DNA translocase FtsK [Duncaniella sp.]